MKNKLLFLNTLFLLSLCNIYSQCPSGSVTFTHQWEIDNFAANYPNCTEIAGGLTIGNGNSNAITSLLPLNNLTVVQDELKIEGNHALTTLSGLQNITTIGSLWIGYQFSDQLTSLSGLEGLITVNGDITIGYNNGLTTLAGLNNLQTVGGLLWITQLPALTSISSLNNLTSVGNGVLISHNNLMTSLTAFQNLTNIDGSLVIGITGLTTITEFNNLQSVYGSVTLQQNNSLVDISSLQYINPLTMENLKIMDNPILTICDLANICTYLSYDASTYPRTIINNIGDCADEAAVVNACNNLSINSYNINNSFNAFTTNETLFIYSENFEIEKVDIYDISGKLLYSEIKTGERLIIPNMVANRLLILKAYTSDGNYSIKKIVT